MNFGVFNFWNKRRSFSDRNIYYFNFDGTVSLVSFRICLFFRCSRNCFFCWKYETRQKDSR
uniref:UvrB protein n=1 Tax=Enterococcus faecalis TaxID=1351 RepID=O50150_ENTFL|nr:uvrB [Enterococcus faecalis]